MQENDYSQLYEELKATVEHYHEQSLKIIEECREYTKKTITKAYLTGLWVGGLCTIVLWMLCGFMCKFL